VLSALVGVTASVGAQFVVPNLSDDLYRFSFFYGDAVPAIGLGLVAAISVASLFGLFIGGTGESCRPSVKGSSTKGERHEDNGACSRREPAKPARYSSAKQEHRHADGDVDRLKPERRVAGSRDTGRRRQDVSDHERFHKLEDDRRRTGHDRKSCAEPCTPDSSPGATARRTTGPTFISRPLPAAASPDDLVQSPLQVDLTRATGSSKPDQFFTASETIALLVVHQGKLVLERYYNGADRNAMIRVLSVTKSWDSAMVGAAIAAGYIHSVDDPATAYIPELARKDPRFSLITLRHLLEMRSGLDWNTHGFPVNDDTVVYNTTAECQAVLDRVRIVNPPGQTFFYTTSMHC
jgi:beta-lactamase family protein